MHTGTRRIFLKDINAKKPGRMAWQFICGLSSQYILSAD
jgi:hypothetical protein